MINFYIEGGVIVLEYIFAAILNLLLTLSRWFFGTDFEFTL
jgi:hypothetical protein